LLTYQHIKDSHAILKANARSFSLDEADDIEEKENSARARLEELQDSVDRLEHKIVHRKWNEKCEDDHRGNCTPSMTILHANIC
jgi:hypothetical protein